MINEPFNDDGLSLTATAVKTFAGDFEAPSALLQHDGPGYNSISLEAALVADPIAKLYTDGTKFVRF